MCLKSLHCSIHYLPVLPNLDVLKDRRHYANILRPRWRLHRENVRSEVVSVNIAQQVWSENLPPPWTTAPKQPPPPNVIVCLHVTQHPLNRTQADTVASCGRLTEYPVLPIGFQPGRRCCKSLGPNRGADTGSARSRPIAIKILMHLIDDVVIGIHEIDHRAACSR